MHTAFLKQLASAYRLRLRAQARRARKGKEPPSSWLIPASQRRGRHPSTGAPLRIETRKEIQDRSAFLRNKTKKETLFAQLWGIYTRKETTLVLLSRCSRLLLIP